MNILKGFFCFIVLTIIGLGNFYNVSNADCNSTLVPEKDLQTYCGLTSYQGCSYNDTTNIKSGATGSISNTFINYYAATGNPAINIFKLGDSNTEGAYINCTGSYDECIAGVANSYQITEDYCEATPNQKIKTAIGYCPLTKCDIADGAMSGYITYGSTTTTFSLVPSLTIPDGNNNSAPNIFNQQSQGFPVLRLMTIQNSSCLMLLSPGGYYNVACKNFSAGNTTPNNPSCYGDTACAVYGKNHSLFFVSITGRLIECVVGTIQVVFNGAQSTCQGDNAGQFNMLTSLQNALRPAVGAALILYTILFGINLSLGSQLMSKGEVFSFVIKMIAVLYFSVGIKDSAGNYQNGVNQYVFNGFYSVMSSFSNYIIGSSEGNLCNFANIIKTTNPNPYIDPTTGKDYSFLALWDSLDCRISYYLGIVQLTELIEDTENLINTWKTNVAAMQKDFNSGTKSGYAMGVLALLSLVIDVAADGSLMFLFALSFLAFEIMFLIIAGIFIAFLLSIAVYFVRLFAMAIVALAIVSYLAVIFVPFSLFKPTKPYFDSWLKLLLSFSLQPVVVAAFLSLLIGVFDEMIFTNCLQTEGCVLPKNIQFTFASINLNTYWWYFSDSACSAACKQSLGYALYHPLGYVTTVQGLFFSWTSITSAAVSSLTNVLLKSVLFCFFLYFFAKKIGEFAAEITSGPQIGSGMNPMKLFNEVMGKVKDKLIKTKKGAEKEAGGGKSGMKGGSGGGTASRGGIGGK